MKSIVLSSSDHHIPKILSEDISYIRMERMGVSSSAKVVALLLMMISSTTSARKLLQAGDDDLAALTTGPGRATAGTQKTADLVGQTIVILSHNLGGIGNVMANSGHAVQDTVEALQDNDGLAGEAVKVLTGS